VEAIWNFIGFVFKTLGESGDTIRTGLREFLAPAITDPFIPFYVSVLLITSIVWVILKLTFLKNDNYKNFLWHFNYVMIVFVVFMLIVGSRHYNYTLTNASLTVISATFIFYYLYISLVSGAFTNFLSAFKNNQNN